MRRTSTTGPFAPLAPFAVSTGLAVALMCTPRDAFALGPVDLEVGAKVGGGTNPFGGDGPNPLGFGLGARAGVGFFGFYGGLQFMYYFGSSQDVTGLSFNSKALLYGLEGGYSIPLVGFFTLRPQLGVGNMQINTSGQVNDSSGRLYLEPGATLLANIASIFAGVDANVLVLPDAPGPVQGNSSWRAAFTAHVQGGIKF